jgi:hypothetical protein
VRRRSRRRGAERIETRVRRRLRVGIEDLVVGQEAIAAEHEDGERVESKAPRSRGRARHDASHQEPAGLEAEDVEDPQREVVGELGKHTVSLNQFLDAPSRREAEGAVVDELHVGREAGGPGIRVRIERHAGHDSTRRRLGARARRTFRQQPA